MKTKQEILDFYGVEIGKKYLITKTTGGLLPYYSKVFEIKENPSTIHGLKVEVGGCGHLIELLNFCDYEEIKPSILDDEEREYLQHYVMNNPAFKGRVKSIIKVSNGGEFLAIHSTILSNTAFLPKFTPNSMYKGMKIGKDYTPKELGLEE